MPQKDTYGLLDFLPYLLNQAAEESSLAFQEVVSPAPVLSKGREKLIRSLQR